MITNNFHILIVKHVGATNANGNRVKIISERFGESKIIPYSNEAGSGAPALDTAEIWLRSKGCEIIGHGEGKGHYYVITSTFKSPKSL